MSWLFSAASSIGPVVGSDSTTAMISAPEITCGSRLPMSEMKKLSAIRSGYLRSSLPGGRPLARAGDDVLLLQLVEQVRAHLADHAGRAAGADHEHRDPQVIEHRLRPSPSSTAGR